MPHAAAHSLREGRDAYEITVDHMDDQSVMLPRVRFRATSPVPPIKVRTKRSPPPAPVPRLPTPAEPAE